MKRSRVFHASQILRVCIFRYNIWYQSSKTTTQKILQAICNERFWEWRRLKKQEHMKICGREPFGYRLNILYVGTISNNTNFETAFGKSNAIRWATRPPRS